MCGIAGFVSPQHEDAAPVLARMTAAIAHRGPDAEGHFTLPPVYLGHRRLSIVDLAGGAQPMFNEDRTVAIVYNGEIFNHASLRPALEQAGHRYASHCDTETILHAYEEYGARCLGDFRGMFAFALWDGRRRELFCARDRLGIKPFYYFWDGTLFAFASEIKALLQHPSIPASLEEEQIPELLAFGYSSGEATLFRGIRKLMPGHHLTLSIAGDTPRLKIERYWDVPSPGETPSFDIPRSDQDWIRETRRRLEETVRMRLMSDVPLGMFLSGGVDSSAIAALIRRQTSGPVKTFAVGYREQSFSELSYAARVASAIGTEHHEVLVSREEFFNSLPRLIWHEDEPIAWPSSVSLAFVSSLAAREVKVVLTGEGSDELFGGYERYRWYLLNQRAAKLYRLLPSRLRAAVRERLASSSRISGDVRRRLSHTVLGRDLTHESLFLDNFYAAFGAGDQQSLLTSSSGSRYANYLRYWNEHPRDSTLSRLLYADQKTYLVELLMKQDQMSMSASIESRVPFLDHTFVEFAAYIPQHLKIKGSEQKYVLKRAVEDLLPNDIVYRRKMGFPTPLRQWLREPEAAPLYERLTNRNSLVAACVQMPALQALLARHRAGAEDATDRVWRLLNLQLWADIFVAGKRDSLSDGLLPSSALPAGLPA
jgi:asparagine synthase (glutamine-hydrolysing)